MSNLEPNTALHRAYTLTATTLKLQLALEQLPWRTPAIAQTLHHWLGELLGPESLTRWPEIMLGVSLTADLRGLTWCVNDEAGAFIPRLARYFERAGVSADEMERIAQAGATFQPARLAGWFEIYEGNYNAGWAFPAPLPLAQALAHTASGPAVAPLAEWAARHDVTTCTRLGRAVGGEYPYTELQIPLPGADVEQQLAAAEDAFVVLDIAAPPPVPVLTALRQAANPDLGLSIWLSATGVVKLGLIAQQPSAGLVTRLYHAADHALDETRAAFEGVLDVPGPASIEGQRLAAGFGIISHYTLSNLAEHAIRYQKFN
ncbi:MAG: hypothetical protein U9Q70_07320 [Chloroflexota bacterium]|nr:hypothetical protein [Chloroflexota bacterium]